MVTITALEIKIFVYVLKIMKIWLKSTNHQFIKTEKKKDNKFKTKDGVDPYINTNILMNLKIF